MFIRIHDDNLEEIINIMAEHSTSRRYELTSKKDENARLIEKNLALQEEIKGLKEEILRLMPEEEADDIQQ